MAGTVFFIWFSRSDEGGRRIAGVDKHERSYYFIDMAKGDETRERILQHAMAIASEVGFEGLSIGGLAKAADMSKSGLFAHFESKEALQLEVLETASAEFADLVVKPALREPRGEPRIRAMFDRWLAWETLRTGGCPFMAATFELDDRPGRLRDTLEATQREWIDTLTRAIQIAMDEGHFHPDIDADQLAYEIYGVFMAFHLYHRLLRDSDARRRATDALDYLLRSAK